MAAPKRENKNRYIGRKGILFIRYNVPFPADQYAEIERLAVVYSCSRQQIILKAVENYLRFLKEEETKRANK